MANSDAKRFADYLISEGVATQVYVDDLPPDVGDAIAVINTGGFNPEPGLAIDYPTIEFLVRSTIEDSASNYNKALEIKNLLLGVFPITLDGVLYKSVTMIGDINWLGYDVNRRPMRSLNFKLIKENEPGSNRTPM